MDSIIANEHAFVRERLQESTASTETLLSVKRRLQEIGDDLRQVYDPDGYTNFLVSYLKQEHEKYLLYHGRGPTHHTYDEVRQTPTCHCDVGECPVGKGRLPVSIRTADDLERAIREYTHEHTAHPIGLHEARRAWQSMCADLESDLSLMKIALAKDVPVETLEDPEALADHGDDNDAETESEETEDEQTTEGHDPTTVMA